MVKLTSAAILMVLCSLGSATAQTDMNCADLIKVNKQMDEMTKGEMAKDADSAAMDKKINDYCLKNPTAKASEAMEKAMPN